MEDRGKGRSDEARFKSAIQPKYGGIRVMQKTFGDYARSCIINWRVVCEFGKNSEALKKDSIGYFIDSARFKELISFYRNGGFMQTFAKCF